MYRRDSFWGLFWGEMGELGSLKGFLNVIIILIQVCL